jgi:hypothetical protein
MWCARVLWARLVQIELLRFLKKKFSSASRVSVERVVSGIGLANVYEFLRQVRLARMPCRRSWRRPKRAAAWLGHMSMHTRPPIQLPTPYAGRPARSKGRDMVCVDPCGACGGQRLES